MTLSQKDLNAIMVDKAFANTEKATYLCLVMAWLFGDKTTLRTHQKEFKVTQFFGKQYA